MSHTVLKELAPHPLWRRVLIIKQKFDIEISKQNLFVVYRRNCITFRCGSKQWRRDDVAQAALDEERRDFAVQLQALKQAGAPIVYFDESSFNVWNVNVRTW